MNDALKRLLDVAVSSCLLILLLPLMFFAAVAILLSMGRPVFFIQERPGKNEHVFRLFKFRTMSSDPSSSQGSDTSRVTPLGDLLRRLSIDELPQLWNVLKGEMSLVGPRPLLVEYLPLYSAHQKRRHEVRPGITGWAQVNGRNAISWEDKFNLDVWYVDHRSLALDFKILLLTARKVFIPEGVNASGTMTMEKFQGSAGPFKEDS